MAIIASNGQLLDLGDEVTRQTTLLAAQTTGTLVRAGKAFTRIEAGELDVSAAAQFEIKSGGVVLYYRRYPSAGTILFSDIKGLKSASEAAITFESSAAVNVDGFVDFVDLGK